MMTLGGANASVPPNFVSVFYDVAPGPPPSMSDLNHDLKNNPGSIRLLRWRIYQEIVSACRQVAPYEIILLTCNVGKSTEFIRKVANDWRVIIRAYRVQVAAIPSHPRVMLYLANDPPPYLTAAQTILHEEELPFAPNSTIRVGPPL
jgi:hypothetical protein